MQAQTTLNKQIPVTPGQKLEFYFDHPELIKFSTWDRNEISITGTVSINGGENDDAFVLTNNQNGGVLQINGAIPNMQSLPKRITVYRNGEKFTFRNNEEFKKYANQNGKVFDMMNTGADVDIVLEIKVPKQFSSVVKAKYGMVEVVNFDGAIEVEATYGGIDAALNAGKLGEILAETSYGNIYSNLSVDFKGIVNRDFHTVVQAKPGSGPKCAFHSKYGNVYLRKVL